MAGHAWGVPVQVALELSQVQPPTEEHPDSAQDEHAIGAPSQPDTRVPVHEQPDRPVQTLGEIAISHEVTNPEQTPLGAQAQPGSSVPAADVVLELHGRGDPKQWPEVGAWQPTTVEQNDTPSGVDICDDLACVLAAPACEPGDHALGFHDSVVPLHCPAPSVYNLGMRRVELLLIALGLACSSSTGRQGTGTGGAAGGASGSGRIGGSGGAGGSVGTGDSTGAGGGLGTAGSTGRGEGAAGSGGSAGTTGNAGRGGTGIDASADAPSGTDGAGTLVWRALAVPGIELKGEVESVWGTGPELYVGTNDGTLLHRGASEAWTTRILGKTVEWIWGSGPGDVYASAHSNLYHSSGDDVWTEVPLPSAPSYATGIWGASASEVFVAAGYNATGTGAILHLRGGTWTVEPVDTIMKRVWGSSATDIWATGIGSETLYQSKGDGTWVRRGIGYGRPPTAVWGSGPGDVYVVVSPNNRTTGNAYVAHSKPDGTFALEHGIAIEELLTVWGSGPGDVYVAGRTLTDFFTTDKAVLYHSIGDGQWTELQVPGQYAINRIDIIWGASASDVYMGGYSDPNKAGVILRGTPN